MATPRNITTILTINNLAAELKRRFAAINTAIDGALKSAEIADSQIKLYTTADKSGTAAFTLDLPTEYFLDQTKTKFEPNFTWAEATYPGSTDPSLNGKPVMVLAIKGDVTAGEDTCTYSFLNMAALVDTYTAKDGDGTATVTVDGYEISVDVNVSAEAGNLLVKKTDGLYVKDTTVAGATKDNLTAFGDDGVFVDSGISKTEILLESDIKDYTEAEIKALLDDEPASGGTGSE